jgi:hypothetical protein
MASDSDPINKVKDKPKQQKTGESSNPTIAVEFFKELQTVYQTKSPISKEKVSKLVEEATKAVRNYKHVVYYVENFIKHVNV